jgi:CRISPR-associated endoribonuclease Cas6
MHIRYQRLNFILQPLGQINMPPYKGSTFRGGFGNTFRKIVCALRRKDCKDCLLKGSCVYAYVFETSPDEGASLMNMKKYEKIPHPFIIEPPEDKTQIYDIEDPISINLILIGRAIDYLAYFIYTFEELGRRGIGKGRGKYSLKKVEGEDGTVIYSSGIISPQSPNELNIPEEIDFSLSSSKTLTLRFLTPARISYRRDLAVTLEFHILIRALLRRLCLLYYFHCERRQPLWNHKQIIAEAEKISIKRDSLRWFDWERYSSRQGVRMKLGGLVGEITYKGHVEPFIPLLRVGEILHVGKGTSFGLGKYRLLIE